MQRQETLVQISKKFDSILTEIENYGFEAQDCYSKGEKLSINKQAILKKLEEDANIIASVMNSIAKSGAKDLLDFTGNVDRAFAQAARDVKNIVNQKPVPVVAQPERKVSPNGSNGGFKRVNDTSYRSSHYLEDPKSAHWKRKNDVAKKPVGSNGPTYYDATKDPRLAGQQEEPKPVSNPQSITHRTQSPRDRAKPNNGPRISPPNNGTRNSPPGSFFKPGRSPRFGQREPKSKPRRGDRSSSPRRQRSLSPPRKSFRRSCSPLSPPRRSSFRRSPSPRPNRRRSPSPPSRSRRAPSPPPRKTPPRRSPPDGKGDRRIRQDAVPPPRRSPHDGKDDRRNAVDPPRRSPHDGKDDRRNAAPPQNPRRILDQEIKDRLKRPQLGFSVDLEINDYPREYRRKATSHELISQINRSANVDIKVRGVYIPPGREPTHGDKKLYLFIEGESPKSVERAKHEITKALQ